MEVVDLQGVYKVKVKDLIPSANQTWLAGNHEHGLLISINDVFAVTSFFFTGGVLDDSKWWNVWEASKHLKHPAPALSCPWFLAATPYFPIVSVLPRNVTPFWMVESTFASVYSSDIVNSWLCHSWHMSQNSTCLRFNRSLSHQSLCKSCSGW